MNELQPVQLTLKGSTDTQCVWMDVEGILGSRRSRIPRATPWRIPFMGSVPTPGKSRDRKQGGGWPGLEQGMARGCLQWGPPPPVRGHCRAGGWWVGPSGARLVPTSGHHWGLEGRGVSCCWVQGPQALSGIFQPQTVRVCVLQQLRKEAQTGSCTRP